MTHLYVWHNSFTCVIWLIHMCDITHSHVWHDSFIYVCDIAHSHVNSYLYLIWLVYSHMSIHMWIHIYSCVVVYSHLNSYLYIYIWYDSCIHMWVFTCQHISTRVYSCIHIWIHIYTWYDSCTGWRRPIRCLISWITFRKLATNYRALLRKMTYKDKASYESSPPCISLVWLVYSHVWYNWCMNELCHIYKWVMYHVWYDSWHRLIYVCDMSHSHVWHDSFIYVT